MKRIISLLFLLALAASAAAQTNEAKKIDEFGIITCGDFMARMDGLFTEMRNNPDLETYVIYYGARFRRHYIDRGKDGILKLSYPHRDDGLNWAKSIPLSLTTDSNYTEEFRNSINDKIHMIDGGFRDEITVEIWLGPKGAKPPQPTPLIDENQIKFRKDKPYPVRNYTGCYGTYENN